MKEKQFDLSISIVNTNNRDMLKSCLQSLYDTVKNVDFEIIVADNCSTDGSIEMIEKHFPSVKVVPINPRNGYGYCHNRCYEKSNGNYFFVLNEDMIFYPNTINNMIEKMKNDQKIGALGCKLFNPDGSLQFSCSLFPTLRSQVIDNIFPNISFWEKWLRNKFIKRGKRYGSREILGWNHDSDREVDVISGCCMLIPREVIKKIGLFDERFYMYSDEVDLCKRIKDNGWKVQFTPDGQIIHYIAFTTKKTSERMYVIRLESICKYFYKHHGKLQAWIVKMSLLFKNILLYSIWWFIKIFNIKKIQFEEWKYINSKKALLWFLGFYKP